MNNSLSLADPPVYSADGKSVTITLKGWKWSDGTQITARDIQFWQNLVTANKDDWAGYSPGEYPDNVTSTTINPTNPLQITFNLSQAYGSYFFTYNELSQITPLPQHVWDKESATGAVGNYDTTPAGAQAVYKFLDSQSKSISTYDTNPLWQVVSGPWKLKSMDTAGNVSMVPNTAYGGPIKPTLTQFNEVPYTKDTAEFDELKAATSPTNTTVDYGYILSRTLPRSRRSMQRLQLRRLDGLADHVLPGELHEPDQRADLQPAVLQAGDAGPGRPEHLHQQGVLRVRLPDLRPGAGEADPRPSSTRSRSRTRIRTARARQSPCCKANGWTVNPGGTSTCTSPGTGTGQCGAGVPAGAKASFNLQYISGVPALDQEMAQFKSDFALAGIAINLPTAPFDTVIGNATPCKSGSPCTWDMEFWGGGWIYAPDYEPTGDELWSCTGSGASVQYAGSDLGGYCDPQAQSRHRRDRDQRQRLGHVHLRGLSREAAAGHLDAGCLRAAVRDQQGPQGQRRLRIRSCRSTPRTGAGPEPGAGRQVTSHVSNGGCRQRAGIPLTLPFR